MQCDNQDFPTDLTINDFNTDGAMDFIALNKGGVSFTLCNGIGPSPTLSLEPEENFLTRFRGRPIAIEGEDFTGDGNIDVAVLNKSTETISLFSRQIGINPYPSRLETALPNSPIDMESGDIDQDGDIDLLVAFQNNNFIAFTNNGTGTFSPEPSFVGAIKMTNFILADINGDNEPDIVTSSQSKMNLSIAFGNLGGGNSTFSNFQDISIPCIPSNLNLGSIDPDPFQDIIINCKDNSQVYIYRNNTLGSFNLFDQYTFDDPIPDSAISDVNGDGIGDIIASRPSTSSGHLLLSDLTQGFSTINTIPLTPTSTIIKPVSFDFMNSNLDIAILNTTTNEISTGLGNNDGTFSPLTSFPLPVSPIDFAILEYNGFPGPEIAILGTNSFFTVFDTTTAGGLVTPTDISFVGNGQGIIPINANNDGFQDVTLIFQSPTTFFITYLSDGVTPYFAFPNPLTFTNPLPAGCSAFDITALNYNGDANDDIAISCESGTRVITYTGNGLGNFTLDLDINTLTDEAREIMASDLDNDGDSDLLVTLLNGGVQVLEFNAGTFTALPPQFDNPSVVTNDFFQNLQQTDFNGDSFPDFYMTDNFSNEIVRLIGGSGLIFTKQEILISGPLSGQTLIDVDSDGDDDIITVQENPNQIQVRNIGPRPGFRGDYIDAPRSFYFGGN